jgi:hypothetical protein
LVEWLSRSSRYPLIELAEQLDVGVIDLSTLRIAFTWHGRFDLPNQFTSNHFDNDHSAASPGLPIFRFSTGNPGARLGIACGPTCFPCVTNTTGQWRRRLHHSTQTIPLSISAAPRNLAVAALVNAWDTSRPRREKRQSFPTTNQDVKGTATRCSSPASTGSGMSSGMRVPGSSAKKASSKDIRRESRPSKASDHSTSNPKAFNTSVGTYL